MVVENVGVNRIRDLVYADLFKGQMGDDDTTPSESQTGLISPVSATLLSFDSTSTGDKQITTNYLLNAGTGNGSTYKEYEIQINSGSTSLMRINFTDIEKTAAIEVNINTQINIIQG